MSIDVVFYEVMINLLQLLIYSLVGTALNKLGIFDIVGERKSAEANLHIFVPAFSFITFSNAVNGLSSASLGIIFFSFAVSAATAAVVAYFYCTIVKTDVRITRVFLLLNAFGNVAFLPETVLVALCGKDGALSGYGLCSNKIGYSMYQLFLFNVLLIMIGPFFMNRDKSVAYNIKRQMVLVKYFYESPEIFLTDKDLSMMDAKNKLEPGKISIEIASTERIPPPLSEERLVTVTGLVKTTTVREDFYGNGSKVPASVLDDPELVDYAVSIHMDDDVHKAWEAQFEALLKKIDMDVYKRLAEGIPAPMKFPEVDKDFWIHMATSKVVIFGILGVIIGRIPTAMGWLYGPDGLKYFMGTVKGVAGLALPLAVMVWGVQLSPGFLFKGSNIRLFDIIGLIILRLAIVPAIGLGFSSVLNHGGIEALNDDKVLAYSVYSMWCIQPGLLLLTLFVLCGYYAREGAMMMFWSSVAVIIASPLYTGAIFKALGWNF